MSFIHYDLKIDQARDHIIDVIARLSDPNENQVISLPSWIPGSYLIREFSKEIIKITAKQNGKLKKVTQINKNTWCIDSSASAELTITYSVFAKDASVRTAWLDLERGFFNGSSVFICAHELKNSKHTLAIHKPTFNSNWKVATALNSVKVDSKGFGLYEAKDYEELIDCPVEMGDFWSGEFKACGVTHRIVVSGAALTFDGNRLLGDIKRICEYQLRFWHGNQKPAIKSYLFILWAVSDGYGGLEHRNSTALIANRSDLPRLDQPKISEGYVQLLGLFSHEYFHTWNIKRLRPREFEHLDLQQENYTELLWFFEGFTSYYDDLVLVRSGLIDVPEYLKLLTKTLNQVLQTPGRKVHTAAQASFEAWTKYYRPNPNTANTTVSYYTKGALIALCLDLTLRKISCQPSEIKNQGLNKQAQNITDPLTLDDLMRKLWSTCKDGLMSEKDLLNALHDLTGKDFKSHLHHWVHTTKELPVLELLAHFGVTAKFEPAQWAQKLGLRISESNNNLVIKQVLDGSIAQHAGLCDGDEWLGIEVITKRAEPGHRLWRLHKLEDIQLYAGNHRYIHALICRDKKIIQLKLDLKELHNVKTLRLAPSESELLKSWLLHQH